MKRRIHRLIGSGVLGGGGAGDTTAPTVEITCAQTSPTSTTPLNMTFTLSEISTDFALADITVGNGTADNFAGSGTSYTCDVTPTAGGAVTVDVAADAFHDAAGNGNTAADQFSITYAPTYATVFGGTNTYINAGNHATVQNLADNAFTAEGWFQCDSGAAGTRALFGKRALSDNGWGFRMTSATLTGVVNCATTHAASTRAQNFQDGTWHHFAMTFDDAGDRKVDIFVDGTEITYGTQVTGVGAVKDDSALGLYIGEDFPSNWPFKGKIGWCRISNSVRYTGTFTPAPRNSPPANDANTIRLFKMDEGTGTTINDSSTNAQDGTLTNGSWVIDP